MNGFATMDISSMTPRSYEAFKKDPKGRSKYNFYDQDNGARYTLNYPDMAEGEDEDGEMRDSDAQNGEGPREEGVDEHVEVDDDDEEEDDGACGLEVVCFAVHAHTHDLTPVGLCGLALTPTHALTHSGGEGPSRH